MQTNPYAPPRSAVKDVVSPGDLADPPFAAVSVRKLLVMSWLTLTFYELVWFYRNWALMRRKGEPVWPLLRSVFAVFYCYGLFADVRDHRRDLASNWLPAGALAIGYIVTAVVSVTIDFSSTPGETPPWLGFTSLLIGYSSTLLLVPVQRAINEINEAEAHDYDRNDHFTVWNWLGIAVGGAVTVMTLVTIWAGEW